MSYGVRVSKPEAIAASNVVFLANKNQVCTLGIKPWPHPDAHGVIKEKQINIYHC